MANVVSGIDLDALLGGDDFTKMDASGAGQYIEPGTYLFKILSCELKQGFKGTTFIGTNEVVQVTQSNEQGIVPGSQRNLVEVLTGKNGKMAQANMKGFLLAACESLYQVALDKTKINPAFVARVLQPDQPLKGVYVTCHALHKPTQAGKLYTAKNWKMITNAELSSLGVQQPKPPG